MDLNERAHQPLSDGDAAIAFVGEIYNYHDIGRELRGYVYRTDCDTEVLLAAYLKWGVEGLRRLRGMFALAIVDQGRQRVVLARDPVGKKPLFLGRLGGATLFGCTVTALVAAAESDPDSDPRAVADYMKQGWVEPSRCFLREFRPIQPGEVVELDWQGNEVSRSDCRPNVGIRYAGETLSEVTSTVSDLLHKAVSRRLENNPVPTALLSGGIDSTVVTASMRDQCSVSSPIQALTLGSLVPWLNDEPYANQAARRLGVTLTTLRLPLRDLNDRVVAALDAQDEPLGMVAYFVLFELVRAASAHGRILMTGDGGDEVFLGYGEPQDWISRTQDDAPHTPVPCGPPLPTWMSAWGRRATTSELVGHAFTKADRASAEQGVEIRCPLLDWDLMCYARSLPAGILFADGRMKAQLKAQLPGWPVKFLERPKAGFTFNMRYLWGLSNYAGLRETIEPDAQEAFGAHAPAVLRKRADKWHAGDIFRNFDAAWRLIAFSRFLVRLRRTSNYQVNSEKISPIVSAV